MSTITTLNTADTGATSRTVINGNFTNLNTDKLEKGSAVTGNVPTFGAGNVLIDSGKTLPTGAVVGTTDSQALTNKSVNGVTISTSAGANNFLAGDGTYKAATVGDASYAAKGVVQGLTDAATSGLTISGGVISVNSGTGANQIVKLDGTGRLPAVDGSQLTNVSGLLRNGTLTMGSGGALLYNTFQVTTVSSGATNGAYFYASSFASAQASGIHAFLISNGYAYRTARTFTNPWTTNQQVGLIALGSFVYGVAFTGAAWAVNRWDAGTLANSTAMTISGGAVSGPACFTDGTSLYFYTSANTMARYTVSGTTLTFAANVTFTSVNSNMPMYSDGTTVWQTETTANNETIYRWPIAGGARTTVTSLTHGITSSSATSQNEVMCGTVRIAGGTDMMVFAYSTNNQPQVQFVTRNAI